MFNLTSGNVSAIGGMFFPTDFNGALTSGSVTVALSDGTKQTLTTTNSSSFLGFIAAPNTFFTSLTVAAVQPNSGFTWPTVNNLVVGTAVPTPALVPAAIEFAVAAWRKRKGEGVEVNTEA